MDKELRQVRHARAASETQAAALGSEGRWGSGSDRNGKIAGSVHVKGRS